DQERHRDARAGRGGAPHRVAVPDGPHRRETGLPSHLGSRRREVHRQRRERDAVGTGPSTMGGVTVSVQVNPRTILRPQDVETYHRDGYVLCRGVLNADEVGLLARTAQDDTAIAEHSYELRDASGHLTRLALWYTPGDD